MTRPQPVAPVKLTATAAIRPTKPSPMPASAHRGMNRNLLILGSAALLVLGGLGFFLASRDWNIFNTEQRITKEIIHNTYFQNLIASGMTAQKDLEAMAVIRPHGDGFIGVSKEALSWEQAVELAGKSGSQVLSVDEVADESREQVLAWLESTFRSHLSSSIWVSEHGDARVLDGMDVLEATALDRNLKAFFHWTAGGSANDPNNPKRWRKAINLLSMVSLPQDVVSGQWVRGAGTLNSDVGQIAKIQIPFEPPPEYDSRMVFTCVAGSGQASQLLSHGGKSFGFVVGAMNGSMVGIDSIDGKGVSENPTCLRVKTELGRKYTTIVQVRNDGIRAFLDNKLVAEWKTDYQDMSLKKHWALRDDRHLGFGSFGTSVIFHSLEILPVPVTRARD